MLAGMMARPRATSLAHEFRRDLVGDRRRRSDCRRRSARAAEIFARGDEFHLLGDDALARIVELRDVACPAWRAAACARRGRIAAPRAARRASGRHPPAGARGRHIPRHRRARESSRGAARRRPFSMSIATRFIRIRTGCVVEPHRRLAARQRHFAERHAVDASACASRARRRACTSLVTALD